MSRRTLRHQRVERWRLRIADAKGGLDDREVGISEQLADELGVYDDDPVGRLDALVMARCTLDAQWLALVEARGQTTHPSKTDRRIGP